ncbi:hypothetical protein E2C01_017675 [Portunus trituberculatus]|uniref:Uncharacterized protein n=1 Tax=Portunus trituberculatus TaxID=210409 RepID=A0A5B7DU60_PORTR|nr:hypothetical protein [Portunus trituberculatus]
MWYCNPSPILRKNREVTFIETVGIPQAFSSRCLVAVYECTEKKFLKVDQIIEVCALTIAVVNKIVGELNLS